MPNSHEKSINEFVKEMKEAFGEVEFKAVNEADGMTLKSKGWIEMGNKFEITGEDYIRLGSLQAGSVPPSEGVIAAMLKLSISKQ